MAVILHIVHRAERTLLKLAETIISVISDFRLDCYNHFDRDRVTTIGVLF